MIPETELALATKLKAAGKLEYETLRHKNIMEELEFMAKKGIKNFVRG